MAISKIVICDNPECGAPVRGLKDGITYTGRLHIPEVELTAPIDVGFYNKDNVIAEGGKQIATTLCWSCFNTLTQHNTGVKPRR